MYQVMPPLSADEYADLEQSIKANGVQVPITVDVHGNIVDGHHRAEIAAKLDRHCPRVTAHGDEAAMRSLAFALNLHRRHLSRDQKRALVAASLIADPQLSDREHARRTGVSHPTVADVRDDLESNGDVESSSTRTDSLGRSQPASKPAAPSVPEGWTKRTQTDKTETYVNNETGEETDEPPLALTDEPGRVTKLTGHASASDPTPEPDPVADYLASQAAVKAQTLRANVRKSLTSANYLADYSVEHVAAAVDDDFMDDLTAVLHRINTWAEAVRSARPRGLRVVGSSK